MLATFGRCPGPEFFYPGSLFSLDRQIACARERIRDQGERPIFLFLNIGGTHVPHFFKGAGWDPGYNPCVPFGSSTMTGTSVVAARSPAWNM